MAGYWLRLIFAKRKNGSTRPIFSHLDRTSLVNKGLKKENFSCGTNAGNPERERWAHLACSGTQSESGNRFILPAREFTHTTKIKYNIVIFNLIKVKVKSQHFMNK